MGISLLMRLAKSSGCIVPGVAKMPILSVGFRNRVAGIVLGTGWSSRFVRLFVGGMRRKCFV